MGVFVWFFIPETKGISLERMDDLFGIAGLVERKLADDIPPHNESSPKDGSATNVEKIETI
jgi:hypothetical protein